MPLDKTTTLSSTTATSGPPWLLWLVGSAALHGLVYLGFTAVLQDRGGAPVPGQRPDSPFTISMEQRQQIADSQQQNGFNPMQNAGMQPGQPRLTTQQLAALTPQQREQYRAARRMQGLPGRQIPTLAQSRQSVAQLWKMRDEWGQVLEAQHAQYRQMIGPALANPVQRARQAIARVGPEIATAQKQQQRATALMHKLQKTTNPAQKWQLRQELLAAQQQAAKTTSKTYDTWQEAASALSFVKDKLKAEYLTADSARYETPKTARLQGTAYTEQLAAANMSPESPRKDTSLPQQFVASRARAFPGQQAKANQATLEASRAMALLALRQKALTQRLKGKNAQLKPTQKASPVAVKALLPELPSVGSTPADVKKQNIAQLYNTSKELEEQLSRLRYQSLAYSSALRKKIKIEDAIQQNGSAPGAFSRISGSRSPAELEQRYPREIAQVESRYERELEEAQQQYGLAPSKAKPLQATRPATLPQPTARPQLTPQQQRLAREMLRRQMGFNTNSRPPRRSSTGQRPNRLGALPPTFAPPQRQPGRDSRPWQPPRQEGEQRVKPVSTIANGAPKPGPKPSQPGSSPEGKLHGKPGTAAAQSQAVNPIWQAIQGQPPRPGATAPMPDSQSETGQFQSGGFMEANPDTVLQNDTMPQQVVPRSQTQSTYGLTEAVQGSADFKPPTSAPETAGEQAAGQPAPKPTGDMGTPRLGSGMGQQGRRPGPPGQGPRHYRPASPGAGRPQGGPPPRRNQAPRLAPSRMEPGNPGELSPEVIEQIRAAAERDSAATDGRPLSGSFGTGNPTLPPDLAKRMQEARQRQANNKRTPQGSPSADPRTLAGTGVAGEAVIPEALRGQPIWSDNVPPPLMPGPGMGGVPGRKILADGVPGADWMFIDSWYTVGPFPNPNRVNLHTAFPPEKGVDLDAVYTGKNNRPVRWEFVQTGSPFLVPADPQEYAVYYAYTELWFEEAQELTIALGSDDAGKLWLNDKMVWQSSDALKPWRQAEDLVKVQFQKGRNRILYRVENGIILVGMSLTISLKPPGN